MAGEHRVLNYAVLASLVFHAVLLFGIGQRDPQKRVIPSGPLFARLVEPTEPPAPKPPAVEETAPSKPAPKPRAAPKPKLKSKPATQPEVVAQPFEPSAPAVPSLPAQPQQEVTTPEAALERPAEEEKPAPSPPPSVIARGEAPDPRMLRLQYGIALKSEMARQVKYPAIARREGWQGKGEVHLEIADSGWISDLRVVRSTGNPVLDKAVVDGVRRAAPRVPIPPGLRGQRFDIAIPFEMNLTDP